MSYGGQGMYAEQHPNKRQKAMECKGCGKRHPGEPPERACEFILMGHPNANQTQQPFKETETFRRLQSISASIRTLEYGRALAQHRDGHWMLVPTTAGPAKR